MAAGQVIVFPPAFGNLPLPTIAQLKQALAVVDAPGKVKLNIPSDPVNTISVGWYEDQFPSSGALYNFVASQLGYSTAQMAAFYISLATYPQRP